MHLRYFDFHMCIPFLHYLIMLVFFTYIVDLPVSP